MKTKNNNNVIFVMSCLLCICIGITLGKLFNWGYFVLSHEISIIDALSIFITIGLAIYITNALEKQIQNRRVEKDLLLAKISETEQCIGIISDVIGTENINYSKLVYLLKNCNKSTNVIFKTIDELKLKSVKKDSETETNLKKNIKDIRRLSTGTSIVASEVDAPIAVENGIIRFSPNRIIEIDSVLDDMKDNYFKLKFMVNME